MKQVIEALSWESLSKLAAKELDPFEGPTNSYANLRLFGHPKNNVSITLYRDHHAWCPYCQKVWLWLEWKRVPYQIKKVTMRCYGNKEDWYLRTVRSGMLPAIEINQEVITESDQILLSLEKIYGPMGRPLEDPRSLHLRRLERKLFNYWCIWLCNPSWNSIQESNRRNDFRSACEELEGEMSTTNSPLLDSNFNSELEIRPGSTDIIFIPYLERMNASLAYYKGYSLREEHPKINNWFKCLEKSEVYRGTQGDFHTHSHDLPPQMGGCYFDKNPRQENYQNEIDSGKGLNSLETTYSGKESKQKSCEAIALARVIKHKDCIKLVNPMKEDTFDQPLRAALTRMITGKICIPSKQSAAGLRYLKDRVSVPRDMPLLSARKLRQSLESTAEIDGIEKGIKIPSRNRLDQNPMPFLQRKD